MSVRNQFYGSADSSDADPDERPEAVCITLSDEQDAALEGWRAANRIPDRAEAVRELVRIGLLSEIARVYQLVAKLRQNGGGARDDGGSWEDGRDDRR